MGMTSGKRMARPSACRSKGSPCMPAVLKESASGEVFQLEDFTLIGRSEGVTVRLGDSSISRQHATIRREGGNYWLVDLGSANGSYVNDVALTSARMLSNGDRLQFGSSVLIFQQGENAPAHDPSLGAKTMISLGCRACLEERRRDAFRGRPQGLHADERAAVGRSSGRSAARMVCGLPRHPRANTARRSTSSSATACSPTGTAPMPTSAPGRCGRRRPCGRPKSSRVADAHSC